MKRRYKTNGGGAGAGVGKGQYIKQLRTNS
jgi:hypothetical protein